MREVYHKYSYLLLPITVLAVSLAAPGLSFAQDGPAIDTGDTAWMLTSSLLVLMMTLPGLFLFYGGLVRSKNALSTFMHSFFITALVSIQWVLLGYTLAFGPDISHLIGGLEFLGLNGVGAAPSDTWATTIPHNLFMVYQLTFAVITVALITGSFAEREIQHLHHIRTTLDDDHIRPARALGMGRRMDRRNGRARFRRRNGGAHQLGRGGSRGGTHVREKDGVRARADGSPLPAVQRDRSVTAVGGLVRVQRGGARLRQTASPRPLSLRQIPQLRLLCLDGCLRSG